MQMNQKMAEYYRSAGLPGSFMDHIITVSPQGLWYPSPAELLEAKVLTDL